MRLLRGFLLMPLGWGGWGWWWWGEWWWRRGVRSGMVVVVVIGVGGRDTLSKLMRCGMHEGF